ncbi:MAG: OsmC family protein [Nitrosomonadales bacterium]|jgi:putative redox protein
MKMQIQWENGVAFKANSESGHSYYMDGASEMGGENKGMRPMEMILAGVAGCTSFDVVTILKKSRQDIQGCIAEIVGKRSDTVPKVFTEIHIHFVVSGKNIKPNMVERAINLSAEKYCSASIMLKNTVKITHDFEIKEA